MQPQRTIPKYRSAKPLTTLPRAFTTIELMVVIGILVILIGLVFAAMRSTITSNKALATRGVLNNLNGMLAELESANSLQRTPNVWLWTSAAGQTSSLVSPASLGTNIVPGWQFDFWKGAWKTLPTNPTYVPLSSLTSPGRVAGDDSAAVAQRNGSVAVVNTSIAMTMLAAIPANRSRLQAIPQPQQFMLTWTGGGVTMPSLDYFLGYMNDVTADLQYAPGVHVRFQDPTASDKSLRWYVASPNYSAPGVKPVPNQTAATSPTAPWWDETAAPYHAPMLLDGWGNPVIFVPATGLAVRMLNGKKVLDSTDCSQNWIIVSPEGQVLNNGTINNATPPVVNRLGRPFFASAGPDGDFMTGDDNMYSFEK